MYKYMTHYGDGLNVVAYDDAETYKMKMEYANDRCLGGTMVWSVDFDAESGGDYSAKGGNNATPNRPDTDNPVTCYDESKQGVVATSKENWEGAISAFCDQVHGDFSDHRVDDREKIFDQSGQQTTITIEAEVRRGCQAGVSIVRAAMRCFLANGA
jgi:hypothetical protein